MKKIVEWDPTSKVVVTEKAGIVKFVDLVDNVTLYERFDETTKKSSYIILDHKGEKAASIKYC